MADWVDSVELTKGRGVWVRREPLIEELPELDLDSEPSVRVPIEDRTTDRTLYAQNRPCVTRPPANLRSSRPVERAEPEPLFRHDLYDEAPDPGERTPPTFDMGLVPASYIEDEPTESGTDPHASVEPFRASIDFGAYDADDSQAAVIEDDAFDDGELDEHAFDADDLSTDCVSAAELARAIETARARQTPVPTERAERPPAAFVSSSYQGFDEVEDPTDLDADDDISLTLDLDPSWLVPQSEQQPPATRTPEPASPRVGITPVPPAARASLAHGAPAPGLAARAPAPQAPVVLRDTVPSYLRTEPQPAALPGWLVNATTFVSGVVVGAACAGTISVLSFTAVILL